MVQKIGKQISCYKT